MKKGALLFAFDNDKLSYTDLAIWSARRIHRFLELPVSLVTDRQDIPTGIFDQIINFVPSANHGSRYFNDMLTSMPWKNLDRCEAYDLTPYDDTLVLDVDYVVASRDLLTLFDCDLDIVMPTMAFDVTGQRDFSDLNFFGAYKMPISWATVLRFRKNAITEMIFGMVKMIRDNWQHYRDIYRISEKRFRNDYAFAIASNTVFGHQGRWPSVPWKLATVEDTRKLSIIDDQRFRIDFVDRHGTKRYVEISDIDFHAMGKHNLGEMIATQG
jgi:hypothetical protein